jgi:transcriptional regulator with XRE-family HTH domain
MVDGRENRIEEVRKSRGYSMEELATRARTTASQINKLEKGKVNLTMDWMRRLASALDCHWSELAIDPPPTTVTPRQQAWLDQIDRLPPEEQERLFKLARALEQSDDGDSGELRRG